MVISLNDVFGVRPKLSEHSYVDRGNLDRSLGYYAASPTHISIRGESKSGKSWLRQKKFPNANIVSCRIDTEISTIYRQILSNLDISLTVTSSDTYGATLRFEGSGEAGWKWLAKVTGKFGADGKYEKSTVQKTVGKDEFDFEFLSDIIKTSGRRVVIEDFHYLPHKVQHKLAHDLKSFWDYSAFFVVIGVWHVKNFLTDLNGELAGRIEEVNVDWTVTELSESLRKGGAALGIFWGPALTKKLASISYNNIGILQSLAKISCFERGIFRAQFPAIELHDEDIADSSAMHYADQITAVFQSFSKRTSEGIYSRKKGATQIYAHAMWAILDADDDTLMKGMPLDEVFVRAHARQNRIQKQNLKRVLSKVPELQADSNGKGVIISFNESSEHVLLLDRSLLFYRRFATVKWPWEEMTIHSDFAEDPQ